MGRLTETLIGDQAYGKGRKAPTIDIRHGGQFGISPDYPAYVSSTPYVSRNLVARLVECPRGFNDLPNPDLWRSALKAFVEVHPKTIEGFNAKLNVEWAETQFGGSGEILQTATNVTRQRPEPSFSYVERYGRPFTLMTDMWITELIMDPNTKIPNVVTRNIASGKPTDLLPDYQGMTVLFFEPDPTFTKVDKAWLCTNMQPMEGVEQVGKRDLNSPGDILEFTMPFTSLAQWGSGPIALAQQLLDEMNLTGANPNLRPAFVSKISEDVKAPLSGIADKIAADRATALPA